MYQQGMSLSLKKIKKKMLLSEHKNAKERKKKKKRKAAKHCNYNDIIQQIRAVQQCLNQTKNDPFKMHTET